MKLYLFDFDGTLTQGDTFFRFLIFSNGWSGCFLKAPMISWAFLKLFFARRFRAETAKAAILNVFFNGFLQKDLERLGAAFCHRALPDLLRPDLLALAKKARAEKNFVAVVSASCDVWLRPFCELHGFELISTELAFENGRFEGRFLTKNCNGPEKTRRIEAYFGADGLADFDRIIAFGNSKGDAAMLAFADEGHWID